MVAAQAPAAIDATVQIGRSAVAHSMQPDVDSGTMPQTGFRAFRAVGSCMQV